MNDTFIESPEYLNLKTLIGSKETILFVGSGLSTIIYGSWFQLVDMLCQNCGVSRPSLDKGSQHLMRKADKCKKQDKHTYCKYLHDHFSSEVVHRRDAFDLLASLDVSIYLTTNFDPLLEDALRRKHSSSPHIQEYPRINAFDIDQLCCNLVYLHGRIERDNVESADNLVLGREGFINAYGIGGSAGAFLQQLSARRRIVFLGFGLEDPYTKKIFENTWRLGASQQDVFHFALLPKTMRRTDSEPTSIETPYPEEEDRIFDERMRQDSGICVIRYPYKDKFHTIIEDILKDMQYKPPAHSDSVEVKL